jgi:alpha-beta hydrolase superfamily lysophospholipase
LTDVQRTIEVFPASDGYPLYYRSYHPVGQPEKAHLVCTHGIQSHGGWYVDSCTRMAAQGYRVSYLDRRGSGLNWLGRGDAPSYKRLLDDLREFIRHATPAGMPAVLLATSWSGKLGVLLAAEPMPVMQKLVLLCPGIFPKVRPPLKVRLGIARARALRPSRLFPIPLSDPQLFTASPEHHAFLESDPLSIHHATARLLVESVRLDRRVRQIKSIPNVPILLLLAEHDNIIRNDRTASWLKTVAPQAKVVEYHGAHHTLEFEPNHPFVDDILRWVAA